MPCMLKNLDQRGARGTRWSQSDGGVGCSLRGIQFPQLLVVFLVELNLEDLGTLKKNTAPNENTQIKSFANADDLKTKGTAEQGCIEMR